MVREGRAVARALAFRFSSHFAARWSTTRSPGAQLRSLGAQLRSRKRLGASLSHPQPMTANLNTIRIYVDADACPVKDEIYRVAARHGLPVSVVAGNFIRVPQDPLIERVAAGDRKRVV